MRHNSKSRFCNCGDCSIKVAIEHGIADAKCDRNWVCQCGHCYRARRRPDAGVDVLFARVEYYESVRAAVRAIKTAELR